jgi:endonuclease/exonuclease/phosphatase family metal-dependent hydrolase
VNKQVGNLRRQVEALAKRAPDVAALQEVTQAAVPAFAALLEGIGLSHVQTSRVLTEDKPLNPAPPTTRMPKTRILIASRWPFHTLSPSEFPIPWPQCVLSVVLDSPWGEVELHSAHVPNWEDYRSGKVETFEGISRRLARESERPRILCGDFNSPMEERADGTVIPWGGKKQAAAELRVIRGLAEFDLADVYRSLHGYGRTEFSWYWKVRGIGRRFDHVFASRSLNAVACVYLHSFRETGLSDHSPIEVDFAPN